VTRAAGAASVVHGPLGARRRARLVLAAAALLALLLAAALFLLAPSAGPPPSCPAVVDVLVDPTVGTTDIATGFEHGADRVVTVAHVIPGRRARVLVRGGGADEARHARVVSLDRRNDLALLAVPGDGPPSASSPLPDSNTPHLLVRRAGRPVAIEVEIRRRIQARIRPRPGAPPVRRPALELEARVQQGDSGAPVLAADGTLLGVLFAQSSRADDDTAYAVLAERLQRSADDVAR
jgi:S1-C subfamily serine protease